MPTVKEVCASSVETVDVNQWEDKVVSASFVGDNSAGDLQVAVEFSGNNRHHSKRDLVIIKVSTGQTINTISIDPAWKNVVFSLFAGGTIIYRIGDKIFMYVLAFENSKGKEFSSKVLSDFQWTKLIAPLDVNSVVIVTERNVYRWDIDGSIGPVRVLPNHGVSGCSTLNSRCALCPDPDEKSKALISTSQSFRLMDVSKKTVGGAIRGHGKLSPTSNFTSLSKGTVGGVIHEGLTILSTSFFKYRNKTFLATCFVKGGEVLMTGWNEEGKIVVENIVLDVGQPSTSSTARHSMHSCDDSLLLLLTSRDENGTFICTLNINLDGMKIQINQSRPRIVSGRLISTRASEGGAFVVTSKGLFLLSLSLITVNPPSNVNVDASSTDDEISSVNSTEDEEESDSVDNDSNVDNDKQDNGGLDPSISDDDSVSDRQLELDRLLNNLDEELDPKKPDPPMTPAPSRSPQDPPAGVVASPPRMSPQEDHATPPNSSARPSIASTPSPDSSSRSTANNQAFSPASSVEGNDAKSLVSTSSVASSSGNRDNASSTASFSEGNDSDDDPTASATNNQAFSPDSSLEGNDAASIASTSSVASTSGTTSNNHAFSPISSLGSDDAASFVSAPLPASPSSGTTSNNTSSSVSSYEGSDDDDSDGDSAASEASSSSSSGSSSNTPMMAGGRLDGGRLRKIERVNYKQKSLKAKLRQEDFSGEKVDDNRQEQNEAALDSQRQAEHREEESENDDESEHEDNHPGVGDVGYKFWKFFDACEIDGTRYDAAWYQGTVMDILRVEDHNHKKSWLACACKYEDGDEEDLTLDQLKELKAEEEAALRDNNEELLRKIAELQDDA